MQNIIEDEKYLLYSIYNTEEGRKWAENPNMTKTFDNVEMFDLLSSIYKKGFIAGQRYAREHSISNIPEQESELYPTYD